MHNLSGVFIESLPDPQLKVKGKPTPYFSRKDN
jgi:hypothetical protein